MSKLIKDIHQFLFECYYIDGNKLHLLGNIGEINVYLVDQRIILCHPKQMEEIDKTPYKKEIEKLLAKNL